MKLLILVYLTFLLISCSSTNKEQSKTFSYLDDPISQESINNLEERLQKIEEPTLSYEIQSHSNNGWCEIKDYSKQDMLELLGITKTELINCQEKATHTLKECMTKSSGLSERTNCNVDSALDECTYPDLKKNYKKLQFYPKWGNNCKGGANSTTSVDPLGYHPETLIWKSVRTQLNELKKELIETMAGEDKQKRESEAAQQVAQDKAYKDSSEYFSKELCNIKGIMAGADRVIQQEKKIGLVGGFVNKNKIYEASKMKVTWEEMIPQLKAEYKKRASKDWSPKNCQ